MTQRAIFPNQPTRELVARAQAALGMTHRAFGEALRSSERTSARWAAGRSSLTVPQLCTLARLVHPRDPALAEQLAAASSETLASLGLAAPPAVAPAPAVEAPRGPVVTDPAVLVDLIVCVAADALALAPSAVRGALLVAFGRARELGLRVEDVEKALGTRAARARAPSV